MTYSLYVIDTETTGLDPEKNDVIEVCFWRIGDEESRTWCLKPLNPSTIEDGALRVNKHEKDDILHKTAHGRKTYLEPSEVLPDIEMYLMEDGLSPEDRVFIGQNPQFDFDFLLNLWDKAGVREEFPFGRWDQKGRNRTLIFDTILLVQMVDVINGKRREKYNLGSLVKSFGITKATAHRADGDVKMTKELFEKIMEPLSEGFKKFSECY